MGSRPRVIAAEPGRVMTGKRGREMRFTRILLVKLNSRGIGWGPRRPPAGLGSIARALERSGISYDVIDCDLGYSDRNIHERISSFRPDLVGFTMVTLGYLTSYRTISRMKRDFPVEIVVGGPHVSTLRERVLEECPDIDYGIVGEGDESIVELCGGESPDRIRGLIFRKNGGILFTGSRPPIQDIDSLGFPTYEGFELDRYFGRELSIITSRGCPYACTYCAVKLIMGTRIRLRSAESVVSELEYWTGRGYRSFMMMDDNFSHDRERVLGICDEIERRGLEDLKISLANGLRADKSDEYLLKRLREAGAYELQIGVEAVTDRVLRLLRKSESVETITTAIETCIRLGYDVGTNMLVGSPGERWEDVQASFDYVKRYPLTRAFFFNIIPYPGTPLFEYLRKNDLLKVKPEEYLGTLKQNDMTPVFETPELSLARRRRLLRQSRKVSEEVRRRYIRRRLPMPGPLSWIAAILISWHVTEPWLKKSKFINRLLLPWYFRTRKRLEKPSAETPAT